MKRTVLLAAATPELLKTLPVSLKLAGLRVAVSKSGLDAIRQARSACPNVIILDPRLPDMDGSTVADILHRLPSTAGIPILLLQTAPAPEVPANQAELLLRVAQVLALCQEAKLEGHSGEESQRELARV